MDKSNKLRISDFVAGDVAYTLMPSKNEKCKLKPVEVRIRSVGTKYVIIENDLLRYRDSTTFDSCLECSKVDGPEKYLFKTSQDAVDFVEFLILKKWAYATLRDWSKIESYSLEQLRKIKEAIDGSMEVVYGNY